MNRDPRYIEIPLNDAGTYTTAAGDISPDTVEFVLDLLNKTVLNPNNTVSKDKLRHVACQLLARNVMLEKRDDALMARIGGLEGQLREANNERTLLLGQVAHFQAQANTTSLTLDTSKLTLKDLQDLLKAQEQNEHYRLMQGH